MSMFGTIMSKIFGTEAKAAEPAPQPSAPSALPSGSTAPKPAPGTSAPGASPAAASATSSAQTTASATATATKPMQNVDVEAVLTEKARHNPQKLDWKHSIVDLMKLLDLDSGLSARKELANELGYTGSTDDSAAMNIWLHREVMKKLAENGGKDPAELAV